MDKIKLFEEYMGYIGKGDFNKVYDLEDGWILKQPLNDYEARHKGKTQAQIVGNFRQHIDFMRKFPEFFPKVKKLDKYRAAIEKLDTKLFLEEYQYVKSVFKGMKNYRFMGALDTTNQLYYNRNNEINLLNQYAKEHPNDLVAVKWANFFTKLHSKFSPIELDMHKGNFGLDKDGNIKMLDF